MVKLRSPAFPPRRPGSLVRYAIAACFLMSLYFYVNHRHRDVPPSYLNNEPKSPVGQSQQPPTEHTPSEPNDEHPDKHSSSSTHPPSGNAHAIDRLIQNAQITFDGLITKEARSLQDAAEAYRLRRGRHPPPGFKQWYEFAAERNAVLVEDFFDQIYHDLNPFWGLEPSYIRNEAVRYEMVINLRNGRASAKSDWFWTKIWLDLVRTIEHLLPDMDIALNAMDEPRMVVPWEDIEGYMKKANLARTMAKPSDVVTTFSELPAPPGEGDSVADVKDKAWEQTKPYWLIARRGCPPDSPARTAGTLKSFRDSPQITMDMAAPHMHQGYVSNYTLSTQFCHQPDLQGLNGIFIEPLSTSATKVLFPMFGGSKLAVNNEILLPAPMYWNEEERFTGGKDHGVPWSEKTAGVIWRGVATGGRNRHTNWKGFQRHRFVSMNNGTKIAQAQSSSKTPINFALPDKMYNLAAQVAGRLSTWVQGWSNVGFMDLMCTPVMEKGQCNYTGPYFQVVKGLKMAEQFDYKYLPDIDGNSFSGRYLGFLRSTSLPLKATMWREWHDSRLVAWKHFVPMDSRFGDYYGIMEYFLGYGDEVPGHDEEAERIATAGKLWAERVLRKEDMQIYTLRLLLEYARVTDDRREKMGWVEDLLPARP